MSLTRTRLRVAVRVMRYDTIIRCPLQGLCRLGAVQTTSLLVVMIFYFSRSDSNGKGSPQTVFERR